MDLNRLIESIHKYIGEALTPLAARIKALEDAPPPEAGEPGKDGAPGEKGADGASVTVEDVLPELKLHVNEVLAAIEPPKDGEKGADGKDGEKGADGTSVAVEDVLPALKEQVAQHLETVQVPDADEVARNLEARIKGEFLPLWTEQMAVRVDEHIKSMRPPADGAPGKDGRDAPTLDELLAAQEQRFKGMFSEWALSFERMANDRVERFLEAIPKPKDGVDALQVEDFDLTVSEDGRVATVSLKAGDRVIEKSIRLATLVDKGIFKPGAEYEAGDGVTWGGSYWVATKDLPTGNPGEPHSEGWRLAVKRGRDAKAPVKLS